MSEKQIKQQQANQISEILSSIKNCNNCPIRNTCNDYQYTYGDGLCTDFNKKDNLKITD